MTVEEARNWYFAGASLLEWPSWDESINRRHYLMLDAASIAYDLAVAIEHTQARPVRLEEWAIQEGNQHARPLASDQSDPELLDECTGLRPDRLVGQTAVEITTRRAGECVSAVVRLGARLTDTPRAAKGRYGR